MSTWFNTFEGGTSGTSVSTGNSGGASGTAFDNVTISATATVQCDNTQAWLGLLSMKVATGATAGNASARWQPGAFSGAQVWFRLYIYFTANPSGANCPIWAATDTAGTTCGRLYVTTAGLLRFNNSAGVQAAISGSAISLNTWVRVEGFLIGHATAGQVEVKLFNTASSTTATDTQTTAANLATNAAPTRFIYGISGANIASQGPYWIDEIGASDMGYLGLAPGDLEVSSGADTFSVGITSTETSSAADAGAGPAPQGSDSASSADTALVAAALSGADLASAGEAQLFAQAGGETGSAADASITTVASTDTSSGADAGSLAAPQDSDTFSGADTGGLAVQGGETGAGTDTGQPAALGSDTASAAEAASLAVTFTSSDTASATEAQFFARAGADTASLADAASLTAAVLEADTASGGELEGPLLAAPAGDTGSAAEALAQAGLAAADTAGLADAGLQQVSDADVASAADDVSTHDDGIFTESEILYKASGDTGSAAEAEQPPVLVAGEEVAVGEGQLPPTVTVRPVTGTDAGHATDISLSSWPQDSDAAQATDISLSSWPQDSDAAQATETALPGLVATDTAGAAEAVRRIHVWATIPDQIFLHGSGPLYGVRAPSGRVVVAAARLDHRLLSLARELGGALAEFPSDADTGSAQDAAVPVVALSVVALAVHFTCALDGGSGALEAAGDVLAGSLA